MQVREAGKYDNDNDNDKDDGEEYVNDNRDGVCRGDNMVQNNEHLKLPSILTCNVKFYLLI